MTLLITQSEDEEADQQLTLRKFFLIRKMLGTHLELSIPALSLLPLLSLWTRVTSYKTSRVGGLITQAAEREAGSFASLFRRGTRTSGPSTS